MELVDFFFFFEGAGEEGELVFFIMITGYMSL
jgi:hypothetical protein